MKSRRTKFWVDATLYACIGMFMFQQGFLSSDDSYKYVDANFLFWLKFAIGSLGAAAGSLKMFLTDPGHTTVVSQPPSTTTT